MDRDGFWAYVATMHHINLFNPKDWGKIILWAIFIYYIFGLLFRVVPKEGWGRLPGFLGTTTRSAFDSSGREVTKELKKSGFEEKGIGFQQ